MATNAEVGGMMVERAFEYTPDADGVQMDRTLMVKAQETWGCDRCKFADANKAIGDQGLCTYPGRPYDEQGNCIKCRQ